MNAAHGLNDGVFFFRITFRTYHFSRSCSMSGAYYSALLKHVNELCGTGVANREFPLEVGGRRFSGTEHLFARYFVEVIIVLQACFIEVRLKDSVVSGCREIDLISKHVSV